MLGPDAWILGRRGVARGVSTILRERDWWSSLGALVGVFLLIQLLLSTFLATQGMKSVLQSRSDLRLEILDSANDKDIQEFTSAVQALPYVEKVQYITREQAYDTAKRTDPELVSFLEEFNLPNPFPETVRVTLSSLNAYKDFSTFLKTPQWNTTVDPAFLSQTTNQETQVTKLLRVTNAVESLVLAVLGIAALALVFILTELTRRRALARSQEVVVEHLFGADWLTILLPFITEASVLAIAASVVSMSLIGGVLAGLPLFVSELGQDGVLEGLRSFTTPLLVSRLPLFLVLEIIASPLLALLGAWWGLRPHLQSRLLPLAS